MRAKSDFIRLSVIVEATTNCATGRKGAQAPLPRPHPPHVNERNEKVKKMCKKQKSEK